MLYCRGFASSKTQEAENVGKKTVPIAVQTIPRRKDCTISSGNGISVNRVVGSFEDIHAIVVLQKETGVV